MNYSKLKKVRLAEAMSIASPTNGLSGLSLAVLDDNADHQQLKVVFSWFRPMLNRLSAFLASAFIVIHVVGACKCTNQSESLQTAQAPPFSVMFPTY